MFGENIFYIEVLMKTHFYKKPIFLRVGDIIKVEKQSNRLKIININNVEVLDYDIELDTSLFNSKEVFKDITFKHIRNLKLKSLYE
jgi:hypothetical protein